MPSDGAIRLADLSVRTVLRGWSFLCAADGKLGASHHVRFRMIVVPDQLMVILDDCEAQKFLNSHADPIQR